LTAGTHNFEVRATDPAGNQDPTPAVQSFVITVFSIRDALLAPARGAHLGAHVQSPGGQAEHHAAVTALEDAIGRRSAIDHYYEPWPDVFPTWREQWNRGRTPGSNPEQLPFSARANNCATA